MKLSEIKGILEQEKTWCEEETEGRLRTDFEDGFIKGLTQAIDLLGLCAGKKE